MVIRDNSSFLDKIRSNIYRARGLKHFISALGIFILVAVFCGSLDSSFVNAESTNAKISAEVNDIEMNISIPDNVVRLVMDPTASLETDTLDVYVTTTAPYGYTLTMSSDSTDLTRTTDLDGSYPTIPTLASNSTEVGFAPNRWGWKLPDDVKWHPFSSTGNKIGYSEEPVSSKQETVSFAGKVNSNTPTGVYELDLTIAATANSRPLSITDVVYMQDFKEASDSDKSSILASMVEGQSYQLEDSRDGNIYYISKLADGRMWFRDNLRLGSTKITKLTPDDTNIASDWNLPAGISSGYSDPTVPQIYVGAKDSTTTSYGSGSGKIGVYYNYCAASAGTYCMPSGSGSGDAEYDLCPAGWRMPTGEEYDALLNAYDYDLNSVRTALSTPIAGYYYRYQIESNGVYGAFWASTYGDSNTMKYLYINNSVVYVTNSYSRYLGYSFRCILK